MSSKMRTASSASGRRKGATNRFAPRRRVDSEARERTHLTVVQRFRKVRPNFRKVREQSLPVLTQQRSAAIKDPLPFPQQAERRLVRPHDVPLNIGDHDGGRDAMQDGFGEFGEGLQLFRPFPHATFQPLIMGSDFVQQVTDDHPQHRQHHDRPRQLIPHAPTEESEIGDGSRLGEQRPFNASLKALRMACQQERSSRVSIVITPKRLSPSRQEFKRRASADASATRKRPPSKHR
jgi:hypothetical protein